MSNSPRNTPNNDSLNSVPLITWIRGIVGAVLGAVAGYFLFDLLLDYGLYAGLIPGSFVGIGFSIASQKENLVAGAICGIAGLIFGFWCDAATNLPPEDLISYFRSIDQVPTAHIVMIVLGGFAAFWFGRGRSI